MKIHSNKITVAALTAVLSLSVAPAAFAGDLPLIKSSDVDKANGKSWQENTAGAINDTREQVNKNTNDIKGKLDASALPDAQQKFYDDHKNDLKGARGEQGERGEQGIQGAQGQQGERGADGKFADLTADEKASLRGEKGAVGKNGVDGKDGKGFKETADGNYDLESKKLTNIADGTDDKDAVNKSQLDTKADKTDLDAKADKTALSDKADKSELANKADASDVQKQGKRLTDAENKSTQNANDIAAGKTQISETQASIGDDEFRKTSVQKRMDDLNQRFNTDAANKNYVDASAKQTLKQANDYTDSKYNQLNGKIKKLRARADSGIAGATAIASLPFSGAGNNSLAGGLGIAKNKVAGAVGYQHKFGEQWTGRATVSVSDKYVQGGAGVGYNW